MLSELGFDFQIKPVAMAEANFAETSETLLLKWPVLRGEVSISSMLFLIKKKSISHMLFTCYNRLHETVT